MGMTATRRCKVPRGVGFAYWVGGNGCVFRPVLVIWVFLRMYKSCTEGGAGVHPVKARRAVIFDRS